MAPLSFLQRIRSLTLVTVGGFGVYGLCSVLKGDPVFYRDVAMPTVHRLVDPERSHELAVWAGKHRLLLKESSWSSASDKERQQRLHTTLLGHALDNPIGIAAGFDKHGQAVLGLQDWGFGFVEVGSVTPEPQDGNERPRVFRLAADSAVINRYGFNSDGHSTVAARLRTVRQHDELRTPIGVNLGKNKHSPSAEADYSLGIATFAQIADYFVINVSSPNTPGLRQLQSKEHLVKLLTAVKQARDRHCTTVPILLKIAPDMSTAELEAIVDVVQRPETSMDGVIVANTTVARPVSLVGDHRDEMGGLSGAPLRDVSTEMIGQVYRLTRGMLPIIGVGGVFNGADAYEKIRAGASAVQLYTALVYEGPPVVRRVKRELSELLKRDGFANVSEAVGVDIVLPAVDVITRVKVEEVRAEEE